MQFDGSTPLWIVPYANGRLLDRAGDRKQSFRLPKPPWLARHIQECGLPAETLNGISSRGRDQAWVAKSMALCFVSAGVCDQGPLTPWDSQALLQLQYYGDSSSMSSRYCPWPTVFQSDIGEPSRGKEE